MDLRDIKEFLRDCWSYILTFAVIIFIFTFVVAFHPVAGNSMTPTLEEGNITAVSKFSKTLFGIKRNQVVIVKKDSKTYIKRVIGLPGENVVFLDNKLYIDDKLYKEDFINENIKTNNFLFEDICDINKCPEGKIPKDQYLVLGDNREESLDSRDNTFGLVKKEEIEGVVIFNIWPIKSIKKI